MPVTNPLAYADQRRTGDRNLNRKLTPTDTPREFEDHVANWLCPLLAEHEVLLDLHSFNAPGVPFVFMGPATTPGRSSRSTGRRARRRWRSASASAAPSTAGSRTYAGGVARRQAHAAKFPEATLDLDPRYGVGTTEYMRSIGGSALTLECGQHEDPAAPDVAYRAIVNTLAHLRPDRRARSAAGATGVPEPCEVIDRLHPDDAFAQAWRSFDPVAEGQRSAPATTAAPSSRRSAASSSSRIRRRAGARVVLSRALEHAARPKGA